MKIRKSKDMEEMKMDRPDVQNLKPGLDAAAGVSCFGSLKMQSSIHPANNFDE